MKIFNRKEEKRAETQVDALLTALITGDTITKDKAMNIPSVTGCIEYISNIIAMLPIKLYKEVEGETKEVKDDVRVRLLNDDTGDTLNAYQMKKAFISDVLLMGRGYIYNNKERNIVKSLHYVDEKSVFVRTNYEPIFKRIEFLVNGTTYRDFEFIKVTRNTKDGADGTGIIQDNNTMLALAYNSLVYENFLVKNGGNKKGFLKAAKKLAPEAMTELKQAWKDLYSNNENNMMVLNDGIDFKESSNSSVEMQLNENKKTNADEICKLFNLSQKVINGTANAEENATAIKTAILPLIISIQTALNKDLLLETEKKSFYFAIDTKELLKGDIEKRYKAYTEAVKAGWMHKNEIRYMEDLPAIDGLNVVSMSLGDVIYDVDSKTYFTPNMDSTNDIKTLKNQNTNTNKNEK